MGFSSMIYGFFFIFFDFNIGKINILPDTIGYIVLYMSIKTVISKLENTNLLYFKKVCFLLIFLSALNGIITYSTVLNGIINNLDTVHGKLFSVMLMLTLITFLISLFFNLTRGIEIEALKLNAIALAEESKRVYKNFSTIQVLIGLFFLYLMLFMKQQNLNLNISGLIPLIIVIVFFIIYIRIFLQVRSLLKKSEQFFGNVRVN